MASLTGAWLSRPSVVAAAASLRRSRRRPGQDSACRTRGRVRDFRGYGNPGALGAPAPMLLG